jgi:predicted HTH transcriptional regulator
MADDALLAELRAIRDLLIMTADEEVESMADDLSDKHEAFLRALDTEAWTPSSEVTPRLAEKFDISDEAIRTKKNDLLQRGFIEQEGKGSGTMYRKTGLGVIAIRSQEI